MDLDFDGVVRRVAARQQAGAWIVTVDGRELEVVPARAGDRWSLLIRSAGDEGAFRSHEIVVEDEGDGRFQAFLNGRVARLAVARGPGGQASATAPAAAGPWRIAAPMPGRVVKVLVRVGETVAARQPLVIVEAMKMENELRAPAAGRVTDVAVAEGALVEARTVLIVVS